MSDQFDNEQPTAEQSDGQPDTVTISASEYSVLCESYKRMKLGQCEEVVQLGLILKQVNELDVTMHRFEKASCAEMRFHVEHCAGASLAEAWDKYKRYLQE